jgi:hypothetical protein
MAMIGHRQAPGRTKYRCDQCGFEGLWSEADFRHWGSIADIEDGESKHYCSDQCLVDAQGKKALGMKLPEIFK